MHKTAGVEFSRRSFVKGSAIGAVGLAAAGVLTGQAFAADDASGSIVGSASASSTTSASTAASASTTASVASVSSVSSSTAISGSVVTSTLQADVVVVGAGASGLACAVEAAQEGNSVILLEKGSIVGGNSLGTEGIFAVGSGMQKDAGIEIDPVDIISTELAEGQYRVDGSLWADMVGNSAENIDWLIENGVLFNGTVDNYGAGLFETCHWWQDAGVVGYVPPMQAAAEAAEVQILTSTRGTELVMEGGIVKGLIATDADGAAITIDAKAVVLASGGIGVNKDLLVKEGWEQEKIDEMIFQCVSTVEGDGYNMAMSVGAKDFLPNAADQVFNAIKAFGTDTTAPYNSPLNGGFGLTSLGPVLWINQDADRFMREDLGYVNMAAQATACKGNRETYAIFDQSVIDACTKDPADAEIVTEALSGDTGDSLFSSDDLGELAGHFGLDADELAATIDRYNGMCEAGKDDDFGKDAQYMQTIATAPFYIAKIVNLFVVVDGGIMTNKRTEVLDESLNAIPGLYAVGLDGAMLWRNVYTQNMPGTQMANNINSGRNAARNATAYIGSL